VIFLGRRPVVLMLCCICDKDYIGQTGHSFETRMKDHHWYIMPYHPDKLAVAKHSINLSHHIQFQDINSRSLECIIRDMIEIGLHLINMNREEGFSEQFVDASRSNHEIMKEGLL